MLHTHDRSVNVTEATSTIFRYIITGMIEKKSVVSFFRAHGHLLLTGKGADERGVRMAKDQQVADAVLREKDPEWFQAQGTELHSNRTGKAAG